MEHQKEIYIKTSISLAPHVMQKIDDYAAKLGVSRSASISVLVEEAFRYHEQIKEVAEFNKNFAVFNGEMKKALEEFTAEDDKTE